MLRAPEPVRLCADSPFLLVYASVQGELRLAILLHGAYVIAQDGATAGEPHAFGLYTRSNSYLFRASDAKGAAQWMCVWS